MPKMTNKQEVVLPTTSYISIAMSFIIPLTPNSVAMSMLCLLQTRRTSVTEKHRIGHPLSWNACKLSWMIHERQNTFGKRTTQAPFLMYLSFHDLCRHHHIGVAWNPTLKFCNRTCHLQKCPSQNLRHLQPMRCSVRVQQKIAIDREPSHIPHRPSQHTSWKTRWPEPRSLLSHEVSW